MGGLKICLELTSNTARVSRPALSRSLKLVLFEFQAECFHLYLANFAAGPFDLLCRSLSEWFLLLFAFILQLCGQWLFLLDLLQSLKITLYLFLDLRQSALLRGLPTTCRWSVASPQSSLALPQKFIERRHEPLHCWFPMANVCFNNAQFGRSDLFPRIKHGMFSLFSHLNRLNTVRAAPVTPSKKRGMDYNLPSCKRLIH